MNICTDDILKSEPLADASERIVDLMNEKAHNYDNTGMYLELKYTCNLNLLLEQ